MSRRIASTSAQELLATESQIRSQLEGQPFDFDAMSAVSNVYRAGTAVRTHMERTVLAEHDLSWVAFTVLWVLWIWGKQETSHVAEEAGITKGTLTGVIKTLTGQQLIRRVTHDDDRRRASLSLTPKGTKLITKLFPLFNQHETLAVSALSLSEQRELARLLRKVTSHLMSETLES